MRRIHRAAILVAALQVWHARAFLNLGQLDYSNLGGQGPDSDKPKGMRFKDVASVHGKYLDLVVDEHGYTPFDASLNTGSGKGNQLNSINVRVGTGLSLFFRFVEAGGSVPAVLDRFFFTLFLVDGRQRVSVHTNATGPMKASGLRSFCFASGTLLEPKLKENANSILLAPSSAVDEDGNPVGGRFASDPPLTDPYELSEAGRKQAVTLSFANVTEFALGVDITGMVGEEGANFVFSGTASVEDFCMPWVGGDGLYYDYTPPFDVGPILDQVKKVGAGIVTVVVVSALLGVVVFLARWIKDTLGPVIASTVRDLWVKRGQSYLTTAELDMRASESRVDSVTPLMQVDANEDSEMGSSAADEQRRKAEEAEKAVAAAAAERQAELTRKAQAEAASRKAARDAAAAKAAQEAEAEAAAKAAREAEEAQAARAAKEEEERRKAQEAAETQASALRAVQEAEQQRRAAEQRKAQEKAAEEEATRQAAAAKAAQEAEERRKDEERRKAEQAAVKAFPETVHTQRDTGNRFHVTVLKTGGRDVGLRIKCLEDCMMVRTIQEGLISDWNQDMPEKEVREGDFIVEVNGSSGTGEHLEQAIRNDKALKLTLVRDPAKAAAIMQDPSSPRSSATPGPSPTVSEAAATPSRPALKRSGTMRDTKNEEKEKLEAAAAALQEAGQGNTKQMRRTRTMLASTEGELGNPRRQIEILQEELEELEKEVGPHDPQVAQVLTNLANAHANLGDRQKQKELLQRALGIKEERFGPTDKRLAVTLTSLGDAYGSLGMKKEQMTTLERALEIKVAAHGEDHHEVAVTIANMGIAYRRVGEPKKALEYFERSVKIKEREFGEDHPKVALTLGNMAQAHGDLKNFKTQRELLERSYNILETHYGGEHPHTALARQALNSVKRQQAATPRGAR